MNLEFHIKDLGRSTTTTKKGVVEIISKDQFELLKNYQFHLVHNHFIKKITIFVMQNNEDIVSETFCETQMQPTILKNKFEIIYNRLKERIECKNESI